MKPHLFKLKGDIVCTLNFDDLDETFNVESLHHMPLPFMPDTVQNLFKVNEVVIEILLKMFF